MADIYWKGDDSSSPTDWNTAANWSGGAVPTASDNVRLVAAYSNNLAGFNASGTALADFVVEKGFSGQIGSETANLQVSCTYFEYSGEGDSYIDLGSTSVDPRILATAPAPGPGEYGLYLIGTGFSVLSMEGGSLGLAAIHGQASTVTTIRQLGGELKVGSAAAVTTLSSYGGSAKVSCNLTNLNVYDGQVTTAEQMTITTVTLEDGTVVGNSSGTITTATVHGGELDLSQTGLSRTVTTLNLNPGGAVKYDPGSVPLSTISEADAPISISTSRI